jgi:hypothetical protein
LCLFSRWMLKRYLSKCFAGSGWMVRHPENGQLEALAAIHCPSSASSDRMGTVLSHKPTYKDFKRSLAESLPMTGDGKGETTMRSDL